MTLGPRRSQGVRVAISPAGADPNKCPDEPLGRLCIAAGFILIAVSTFIWLMVFPALWKEPLSDDVFYHMLSAREMIEQGRPVLFKDEWFTAPAGRVHIYPPLFHWVLAGLSLGDPEHLEAAAVYAQCFLGPLALLSFFVLALGILEPRRAFAALVLLAVSFPFGARTHLAVPEALEHIVGPLLVLAWLKRRELLSGILLLLLFLNHSITPFLVLGALVAHELIERRRSPADAGRRLAPFLLVPSAGILLQLVSAAMNMTVEHFDADKLRPTLGFVLRAYFNPLYGTSCILVPLGFGLWGLWRYRSDSRFLLLALLVAAHLPMLFTYSARFSPYALVPLSLAAACAGADLLVMLRGKGACLQPPPRDVIFTAEHVPPASESALLLRAGVPDYPSVQSLPHASLDSSVGGPSRGRRKRHRPSTTTHGRAWIKSWQVSRFAAGTVATFLLAVQAWSSFHLFKYSYDFTRESDRLQKNFLKSLRAVVPESGIVCVDELFQAYRVAWYMERRTTLSALNCQHAQYRYTVGFEAPSPWVEIASSGAYHFYARPATSLPAQSGKWPCRKISLSGCLP